MRRAIVAIIAPALLLVAIWAASTHWARAAQDPEWWQVAAPTSGSAHAIGGPSRGCLAGGTALPADGPGFQVMRPSRERMYGHPRLIQFIESLAADVRALGWTGILVGDLGQPRGGPTPSGHRSHQNGLDVDVWFMPAPPRLLTDAEREDLSATSVVDSDGRSLNPATWTPVHAAILRAAANHDKVDRIFVNAAIKKELCATAGFDRGWLRKIRPWWGHDDHFHVRLSCPREDGDCEAQDPPPPGDGCDASLDWWFSDEAMAQLRAPKRPAKPITLDDLPAACRSVLRGG